MKKSNLLTSLFFLALAIGGSAYKANAESVTFDSVAMNGSGCPLGTVSTVFSPDGSSVSFIFDRFGVESKTAGAKQKSCNMRLGTSIPQGFTITQMDAIYRGFADVGSSGSGAINSIWSYNGKTLSQKSSQLKPGFSSDYQLTNTFDMQTLAICTTSVNLGLNSSVIARGLNTTVGIDTLDLANKPKLEIKLALAPCN